jgi:hypothetical protein
MIEDIKRTKEIIACSVLISMFFGFVTMILMKGYIKWVTWTIIFLFYVACIGITYYTYTLGILR